MKKYSLALRWVVNQDTVITAMMSALAPTAPPRRARPISAPALETREHVGHGGGAIPDVIRTTTAESASRKSLRNRTAAPLGSRPASRQESAATSRSRKTIQAE